MCGNVERWEVVRMDGDGAILIVNARGVTDYIVVIKVTVLGDGGRMDTAK